MAIEKNNDLPSYKMGGFSIAKCNSLPESNHDQPFLTIILGKL